MGKRKEHTHTQTHTHTHTGKQLASAHVLDDMLLSLTSSLNTSDTEWEMLCGG